LRLVIVAVAAEKKDARVTQVVNGAKGIHVMLEKKLLQKGR
jgi:hypothetical protein